MIKRIAQTAGFTGLLAALLLTLLQSFWVAPLILQAETYEKPAASETHDHADMNMPAHEHDAEAWEPEDGWQRVLSTTGGNLVVAVGFALMLAGLYTLRSPTRTSQGLLWGLAGYAVFCLAPTMGLPPPTCCNASFGGSPRPHPQRWGLPCWSSANIGRSRYLGLPFCWCRISLAHPSLWFTQAWHRKHLSPSLK